MLFKTNSIPKFLFLASFTSITWSRRDRPYDSIQLKMDQVHVLSSRQNCCSAAELPTGWKPGHQQWSSTSLLSLYQEYQCINDNWRTYPSYIRNKSNTNLCILNIYKTGAGPRMGIVSHTITNLLWNKLKNIWCNKSNCAFEHCPKCQTIIVNSGGDVNIDVNDW